MDLLATIAVLFMALVHLMAGRLRNLHVMPRSRWLSFAGGTSVAYVFLLLLPELAGSQQEVGHELGRLITFLENHVYYFALVGLSLFYGLEKMAVTAERKPLSLPGLSDVDGTFWLHTLFFAIYNALIGYLTLHERSVSITELFLFTLAISLHFVVNDFGLREHHPEAYDRIGRWILAGAVVLGLFIGLVLPVSELSVRILLAFLAGGVVLNVLKEELPRERESHFLSFALGAFVYAALLLLIPH